MLELDCTPEQMMAVDTAARKAFLDMKTAIEEREREVEELKENMYQEFKDRLLKEVFFS